MKDQMPAIPVHTLPTFPTALDPEGLMLYVHRTPSGSYRYYRTLVSNLGATLVEPIVVDLLSTTHADVVEGTADDKAVTPASLYDEDGQMRFLFDRHMWASADGSTTVRLRNGAFEFSSPDGDSWFAGSGMSMGIQFAGNGSWLQLSAGNSPGFVASPIQWGAPAEGTDGALATSAGLTTTKYNEDTDSTLSTNYTPEGIFYSRSGTTETATLSFSPYGSSLEFSDGAGEAASFSQAELFFSSAVSGASSTVSATSVSLDDFATSRAVVLRFDGLQFADPTGSIRVAPTYDIGGSYTQTLQNADGVLALTSDIMPEASEEEAEEGTASNVVMTPRRVTNWWAEQKTQNQTFSGVVTYDYETYHNGYADFHGDEGHYGTSYSFGAEFHSGAVTFSGTTVVPTVAVGDDSTKAASTAWVNATHGHRDDWMYLDGTSGSALSNPDTALVMGSGDFSFYTWVRVDDYPAVGTYNIVGGDTGAFGLYVNPSGQIGLLHVNTLVIVDSGPPVPLSSWTHLAVMRTGTTMTLHRDGQLIHTVTYGGNFTAQTKEIGSRANNVATTQFKGFLANLVMAKSYLGLTGLTEHRGTGTVSGAALSLNLSTSQPVYAGQLQDSSGNAHHLTIAAGTKTAHGNLASPTTSLLPYLTVVSTGDTTLAAMSARTQDVDPNGADRTFTLPVIDATPLLDEVAAGWDFCLSHIGTANLIIVNNSAGVEQCRLIPGDHARFTARSAPGTWSVDLDPENQTFLRRRTNISLLSTGTVDLFTVPPSLKFVLTGFNVQITGATAATSSGCQLLVEESSGSAPLSAPLTLSALTNTAGKYERAEAVAQSDWAVDFVDQMDGGAPKWIPDARGTKAAASVTTEGVQGAISLTNTGGDGFGQQIFIGGVVNSKAYDRAGSVLKVRFAMGDVTKTTHFRIDTPAAVFYIRCSDGAFSINNFALAHGAAGALANGDFQTGVWYEAEVVTLGVNQHRLRLYEITASTGARTTKHASGVISSGTNPAGYLSYASCTRSDGTTAGVMYLSRVEIKVPGVNANAPTLCAGGSTVRLNRLAAAYGTQLDATITVEGYYTP